MGDSSNSQLAAYKEILKVTTKHHTNDGSDEVNFKPLNEEDKKFIEEALKETIEKSDPVKLLEKTLSSIKEASDKEAKLELINDLIDIVGQIDLATIFVKNYHGLDEIQYNLLNENDVDILSCYITLLTTVTSNNIDVQDYISKFNGEHNFLKLLLDHFIKNNNAPEKLRIQSLGSISAIVCHHKENFVNFLTLDGISILRKLSETEKTNNRFLTRIMYTLNSIGSSIPDIEPDYKKMFASEFSFLCNL
uniref:Fes1 domain-containing protein n=1 Tax=Strongyloides stercoralis TaxID=6248 RepID=A0A0K0ELG1_STRER